MDERRREAAAFQRARRAADRERAEEMRALIQQLQNEAQGRREAEERAREAEERAQNEAQERRQAEERVREAEERARVAEERAQNEARQRRELQRINGGTFYATLNYLWGTITMAFVRAHFTALLRQRCPPVYEHILNIARDVTTLVTDDYSTSRGSHRNANLRNLIWPTDIFGQPGAGQLAHLIPASPQQATIYDDVATWALGLTPVTLAANIDVVPTVDQLWAAKQRVIHGAKREENGRRIADTGLKHSKFNKIFVVNQGVMLDTEACLLIVPCLSLDGVRNWNGEGYDAIVLPEIGVSSTFTIQHVCASTGMTAEPPDIEATVATEVQVEEARSLLESVLCGLAFSLANNNRPPDSISDDMDELLTNSRNVIVNVVGGVTVPVARVHERNLNNDERHPVRKITFGANGDTARHQAPDPLLLAVKAAVSWSKRNEQQLLAAGERPEDIDILSLIEEERQVHQMSQALRPKTFDDLAAGLLQPNGCQDTQLDSER